MDNKICFNAISTDITRISLDEPVKWLWIDDSTYGEYLTSTFELLCEQAVPAAPRIEELLNEDPRTCNKRHMYHLCCVNAKAGIYIPRAKLSQRDKSEVKALSRGCVITQLYNLRGS